MKMKLITILALALYAFNARCDWFGSDAITTNAMHGETNYIIFVKGSHSESTVWKISPSNVVDVLEVLGPWQFAQAVTFTNAVTNLQPVYIRQSGATPGQLSLYETNGTFAQILKAADNLTNDFIFIAPTNHGTAGQVLSLRAVSGQTHSLTWSNDATGGGASGPVTNAQITLVIDGGGSVITTGAKGWTRAKDTFTITGWDITADQTGSCVVDVWKDTYANFPPTVADTIAGTEKPTLSAAQKNQDVSFSSFTGAVTKGDYIRFNVDSASTVTYVVVTLYGY